MKRHEKEAHLSKLSGILSSGMFLVSLNFSKLSASDFLTFRRAVRELNGSVLVVKNTIAKLALSRSEVEKSSGAAEKVSDSVVFVYGEDAISLSKVVTEFCKNYKNKLKLLFGIFQKCVISTMDIASLSEISSIDDIRARLLFMISHAIPIRICRALSACSIGVVRILDSKKSV